MKTSGFKVKYLSTFIFLSTLLPFYHSTFLPCLYAQEYESATQTQTTDTTAPATVLNQPVYVCNLPNINDYDIFASGGWDGNWYVGYNVCWIVRLYIPEELNRERFSRFFIGAKLGRAKTRKIDKRPSWEREPIPGSVYIAISSTSAWKSNQRYFLVSTLDIALEDDFENALEGTGEARWFWADVAPEQVNFDGPNFIALWSPTEFFVSRDTSPILAGGWGAKGGESNTWLNDEIQGSPPIEPSTTLKTPISVFEPAIALKLIPSGDPQEIIVSIETVNDGRRNTQEKVIRTAVYGNNIERVWMEVEDKEKSVYKKIWRYIYNPPYIFTLKPAYLAEGKVKLRVAAQDVWGNTGFSEPIELNVERVK
ncbi:MAG: hypothetical protein AB1633_00475 [Elusimicrobiota bacterium]